MIKKIHLENFKCFESMDFDLSNINILTGINGMGKSTLIQSLLLLMQSSKSLGNSERVLLNGEFVQLGYGRDILYEAAGENEEIVIEIDENGENASFKFKYEAFSDELELVNNVSKLPQFCDLEKSCYLSAYRIAPSPLYDITNEKNLKKRNFGNNGVYALQYLKEFGGKCICNSELCKDSLDNTLREQVSKWMNEIVPGVSIHVDVDIMKNIAELGYSFRENDRQTNTYSCMNVGFGITYVLPIIVALLSAEKGDLLILENPEAHIHPSGQRKLGELIGLVGQSGVQLIVETHSDHILNGIRIAVKKGWVDCDNVKTMFFYKDKADMNKHKYDTPHINQKGHIDFWPESFFDTWDEALVELL